MSSAKTALFGLMTIAATVGMSLGNNAQAQEQRRTYPFPKTAKEIAKEQRQDSVNAASQGPTLAYNIKTVTIHYNETDGEIEDMRLEGWSRPGDSTSGLNKLSLRLNTKNHNRAMDAYRQNNNAVFFNKGTSLSSNSPYVVRNTQIIADVDMDIKASGYAFAQEHAFLKIPEEDNNNSDAENTLQIYDRMSLKGKNVLVTITNQFGRPLSITPQQAFARMANDMAAPYGYLINGFSATEYKQFDENDNNKLSRYGQRIIPYIPGQ